MSRFLRSLVQSLPFCLVLFVVPGTMLAQAGSQLETAAGRDPLSTTLVEVSLREVRFAFPSDTSGRWGWSSGQPMGRRYEWSALVGGMDGPTLILLAVYPRDSSDPGYSSLQELVAAGQARLCIVGFITSPCNESPLVRRAVEGHRVVLTLSDSTLIRDLFGTRPDSVRVARQYGEAQTYESQSVAVRYVSPHVPAPDSALLAEAERRRRRYEASITTIDRSIEVGAARLDNDDLWLAVGDSLRLDVMEIRCRHDHCTGFGRPVGDSGWSVQNSRIVALRQSCGPGCAMAYGRRLGKTTIRVRGLHGPSDTALSWRPPPREAERRIRVGRPVVSIRILPRPDTALLGKPQTFGAQALDRGGKVVPDVPIEILVQVDSNFNRGMLATRPAPVEFETPGRRRVVATFRGLADTLMITVVGKTNAR